MADTVDRRKFLKASAAGAALSISAPYVSSYAAPLTLRFAHFGAEEQPSNIATKQFANRVESRTDGAVKINIFPNNVLGGPPEQAKQIKLGTIDMGLPQQEHSAKSKKASPPVMLPFVWDGPQHVYRVLDGPGMDWLAPLAERQGFVLLHNWEYGFRNVTNTVRPINTPDDVRGLKLRTPPELQIQASLEAVGATVQAIAFPELYLALSQKVVDGQENPIAVIYFSKFYEVQKHLALTRHIYNNMIHTVSVASWKKLDAGQQAIFREESAAAGDLMRKLIAEQEADPLKKIEAAGGQGTHPA